MLRTGDRRVIMLVRHRQDVVTENYIIVCVCVLEITKISGAQRE